MVFLTKRHCTNFSIHHSLHDCIEVSERRLYNTCSERKLPPSSPSPQSILSQEGSQRHLCVDVTNVISVDDFTRLSSMSCSCKNRRLGRSLQRDTEGEGKARSWRQCEKEKSGGEVEPQGAQKKRHFYL